METNWKRLPKGKKAALGYLMAYADKTFKARTVKNNRGDYGYDEIFSIDGVDVYRISVDGAHTDVQHYGMA